ncbi:MAG: two-component regulator propeller domain-containing protein, partial [Bacteroidota bacterium]|nr:two-component regulator propeller domain-containing protein [Bacteroidota bacterium]
MRNLLLTFCLYASVSLNAINYDVSNLTNNDGLSNSSVNTIFQDTQGLLWFGTWDGLNAFNGREFTAYKPDPGNNRTISNNIIRDMVEAPKGILWIATDRGINRLDESKHAFERFFVEAGSQRAFSEHSFLIAKTSSNDVFAAVFDQGLFYFNASSHRFVRLNLSGHVKIRKLFFDQDDHLWFYTEEKELFKIIFRKSRSTIPQIRHIEKFQHLKDIDAVFYNPDHELWLQTSGGTCYSYQISEGLLTEYPVAFKQIGSIRTVIFGEDRQLIGTADGLFRYDLKTRQLETLLPNVSVLSIFSGTQQIIWVGTDMQGVWQLSPPREKIRSYSSGTIPLFGRSAVRAIFEDRNNTLWVGTKGSGIYLFPPNGEYPGAGYAKRFTTKDGLLSDAVFTIVQGQQHEYWIGTDGRGINYYDINTKRIQSLFVKEELRRHVNLSSVYSILPADQNTLWVGTSGYGMYKLTVDRSSSPYTIKDYKQFIFRNGSSTALSNNIVYSIIRGDKTHLWIATRGGGLNRFDCQKETFQSYRYSSADPNSISSDDILCLYKDKQGFLWAGTSMGLNKLVRFHNQSPVFVRFTEKEGMPNNTIHGMLQDKEHSMWLSTNNGIANLLFEHGTYRIIPYFRKDGLQNNEFSDGAFYESPYSHKFYFGGINGFNVFNASGITHSNYMPSLLLDAFYVENSETNLPDM